MIQFQLFDAVKLTESIPLSDGGIASQETHGAIVEVLNNGEAYLVELFGGWVKYDTDGNFIDSNENEASAFIETIGVEIVYPHQLTLIIPVSKTIAIRDNLNTVLDKLSDDLIAEVKDFAEFLYQKQKQLN